MATLLRWLPESLAAKKRAAPRAHPIGPCPSRTAERLPTTGWPDMTTEDRRLTAAILTSIRTAVGCACSALLAQTLLRAVRI